MKYILTFVIYYLHSAMWISPVVLSSFTCGNVFEHLSYKGAPVNCCWAIRYANKSWALKKRQLVHVAFDEKHAVWNGQCRALKKEFTLMAFLWIRFFWQCSISPPVRHADSFKTMMPSHFSPFELRRPFCFFEVRGLTRRPFRLHH